jgi:large subunit ribosomal protein L4
MATCLVRDWDGKEHGKAEINLAVARQDVASHIVHRALRCQLTNSRQGTASTRTRSQVRGGGRKPWRQKGTGRARAGSIRSPLWRGGGVAFGPKPRDYSVKMNRKEWRLAIRTAFQSRINDIVVIESVESYLPKPKTKEFVEALKRWDINPAKETVLFILSEIQTNTYLSTRNLPRVKVLTAKNLNIFDVLATDRLLVTKDALEFIHLVYGEDYRIERRIRKDSLQKQNRENKSRSHDSSVRFHGLSVKKHNNLYSLSEASMKDFKCKSLQDVKAELTFPDKVEVDKTYDLEVSVLNAGSDEQSFETDSKLEVVVAVSPLDFAVEGSETQSIEVCRGLSSATFQLTPKRKGDSKAIKVDFLQGSRFLNRGELTVFVH